MRGAPPPLPSLSSSPARPTRDRAPHPDPQAWFPRCAPSFFPPTQAPTPPQPHGCACCPAERCVSSGQNSPSAVRPWESLQSPAEPFGGRGQQGTNCHPGRRPAPQALCFAAAVISWHLGVKGEGAHPRLGLISLYPAPAPLGRRACPHQPSSEEGHYTGDLARQTPSRFLGRYLQGKKVSLSPWGYHRHSPTKLLHSCHPRNFLIWDIAATRACRHVSVSLLLPSPKDLWWWTGWKPRPAASWGSPQAGGRGRGRGRRHRRKKRPYHH